MSTLGKLRLIMSRALLLAWRTRLRSALIVTSAMLGVAGAVASVDYASGGRERVLEQIRRMGTNLLIVTPQQSRAIGGRARTGANVTTLKQQDYTAILRGVPDIDKSAAWLLASFPAKAGDLTKNGASVMGCEPDFFAIKNWSAAQGALFDVIDERRANRVAVLGATVARDLFGDASPVGRPLLLNRVPFRITGVLEERGQSLDSANEDDRVYIPLSTSNRRLSNLDYFSGILVQADAWDSMDAASLAIAEVLRERHRTVGKLPDDFLVQSQKQLIATELASAEELQFFVQWAGGSALLVSGLGILAVLWIAVKERTVEFGVRRALGATAGDIFFQVLFEALVLSLAGAALGLLAGREASRLIARFATLPFVFDRPSAAAAFAVSSGLNLVFALAPCRRAASVSPMVALKYE